MECLFPNEESCADPEVRPFENQIQLVSNVRLTRLRLTRETAVVRRTVDAGR